MHLAEKGRVVSTQNVKAYKEVIASLFLTLELYGGDYCMCVCVCVFVYVITYEIEFSH